MTYVIKILNAPLIMLSVERADRAEQRGQTMQAEQRRQNSGDSWRADGLGLEINHLPWCTSWPTSAQTHLNYSRNCTSSPRKVNSSTYRKVFHAAAPSLQWDRMKRSSYRCNQSHQVISVADNKQHKYGRQTMSRPTSAKQHRAHTGRYTQALSHMFPTHTLQLADRPAPLRSTKTHADIMPTTP